MRHPIGILTVFLILSCNLISVKAQKPKSLFDLVNPAVDSPEKNFFLSEFPSEQIIKAPSDFLSFEPSSVPPTIGFSKEISPFQGHYSLAVSAKGKIAVSRADSQSLVYVGSVDSSQSDERKKVIVLPNSVLDLAYDSEGNLFLLADEPGEKPSGIKRVLPDGSVSEVVDVPVHQEARLTISSSGHFVIWTAGADSSLRFFKPDSKNSLQETPAETVTYQPPVFDVAHGSQTEELYLLAGDGNNSSTGIHKQISKAKLSQITELDSLDEGACLSVSQSGQLAAITSSQESLVHLVIPRKDESPISKTIELEDQYVLALDFQPVTEKLFLLTANSENGQAQVLQYLNEEGLKKVTQIALADGNSDDNSDSSNESEFQRQSDGFSNQIYTKNNFSKPDQNLEPEGGPSGGQQGFSNLGLTNFGGSSSTFGHRPQYTRGGGPGGLGGGLGGGIGFQSSPSGENGEDGKSDSDGDGSTPPASTHPVPEPSVWILLGIGVLGLLIQYRTKFHFRNLVSS